MDPDSRSQQKLRIIAEKGGAKSNWLSL